MFAAEEATMMMMDEMRLRQVHEPPHTRSSASSSSSSRGMSRCGSSEFRKRQSGSFKGARGTLPRHSSMSRHRAQSLRGAAYTFQYDLGVATLVLPCAVLLLAFAGQGVATVLVFGMLLAYIMDSMRLPVAALSVFWIAILAAILSLWISGMYYMHVSVFSVFLLSSFTVFLVLCAVWGTLHVPWFQEDNADLMDMLEQLLMSCLALPTTALLTWGIASVVGIANSPYVLCVIMFISLRMTIVPTQSYASGDETEVDYIVGSVTTAIHLALFLVLPAAFYIAIHHRQFSTSFVLSNVLLLLSISVLLTAFLTSSISSDKVVPGGMLWWTSWSADTIRKARPKAIGLVLAVLVACIEHRVVLHTYTHMLVYWSSNPLLATVLVTFALFTGLGAFLLATHDSERGDNDSERTRRNIFKVCMHVCALSSAVSVGVPLYLLPFVMLGAETGVQFFFTRQFWHYILFVIAAAVGILWFMKHTFWFLNVEFGMLSLQQVSYLMTSLLVVALLVPGLTIVDLSPFVNSAMLVVYTSGVMFMEFLLTQQNRYYETPVYGLYFVLLTSFVGMFLAHVLRCEHKITAHSHWFLYALNIAKLVVLIARSSIYVWHALLLSLAISSLFFLYEDEDNDNDRGNDNDNGRGSGRGRNKSVMSKQRAVVHVVSIMATIFIARRTILAQLIHIAIGRTPPDNLVFAGFLIACSVAVAPISFRHLRHVSAVRRANSIAVAIAFLFAFIQPDIDFEFLGAARGGSFATSVQHVGALAVTGAGGNTPKWPSWLLFLSLALIVISITSILPLPRLLFGMTLGTFLGLYVCGLYLPPHALLYALFVVMFNSVAVLLVYLFWPTSRSSVIVPASFALFVALLPVTYMCESLVFGYAPRRRGKDLLLVSRVSLLGVHAALCFMVALGIKMSQEAAERELDKETKFRSSLYGVRKSAIQRSMQSGSDVQIGNIAIMTCFVLTLWLHVGFLEGTEISALFLSPILLLLNRDSGLLHGLTEERRYFPVVAIASLAMFASATYTIFLCRFMWSMGVISSSTAATGVSAIGGHFHLAVVVKHVVLLALAVPSQVSLLKFMWGPHQYSDFALLVIGPLNLLPLAMSDVPALQALAAMGIVGIAIQLHYASRARRQGLSVI